MLYSELALLELYNAIYNKMQLSIGALSKMTRLSQFGSLRPVLRIVDISPVSNTVELLMTDTKQAAIFLVHHSISQPFFSSEVQAGALLEVCKYEFPTRAKVLITAYRTESNKEYTATSAPTTDLENYVPLNSLIPYNSDFKVKVRVIKKLPVKNWENARGHGKVFTMLILDRDSTEMTVSIFNTGVEMFYNQLHEGKVYIMGNGSVKLSNARFNFSRHKYQLIFDEKGLIKSCEDDPSIPFHSFNFVTFDLLQHLGPKSKVDVLGVIIEVGELFEFSTKSGQQSMNRTITLLDSSKLSVDLTLWNEEAQADWLRSLDLNTQPILAVKYAQVTSFHQISISTLTGVTTLILNPLIEAATELRNALRKGEIDKQQVTPLTVRTARRPFAVQSIEEVRNQPLNPETNIEILGKLSYISPDIDSLVYNSCPNCFKKVVQEDEYHRCYHCNIVSRECTYRYVMKIRVSDASGHLFVTAFDEVATKILGKTANELKAMGKDAEALFESLRFKEYQFTLKGKLDQGRQSFIALKVSEPELKSITSFLLTQLQLSLENL